MTQRRRISRAAKRRNMPTIVRGENVRRLRESARLSEGVSPRDPSGQRPKAAVRTFSGVLSRFAERDVRCRLIVSDSPALGVVYFLRIDGGRISVFRSRGARRRRCVWLRGGFAAGGGERRGLRTGVGGHPDGGRAAAHHRGLPGFTGPVAALVCGPGRARGGDDCGSPYGGVLAAACRPPDRC